MNHVRQKTNRTTQSGFSLVELMVSLSIFAIVMTMSTGTLLVLIDMNAKAQAIYSATSNISFALDSMSREIRTGHHYYCDTTLGSNLPAVSNTRDCVSGGSAIAFVREKDGVRVGYRLNGTTIERKENLGNWMPITAPDVVIEIFGITVVNTTTYEEDGNNSSQPTADLVIKGHVNNGLDTETDFNIQTRMVGRRLDVI